MIQQLYFYVFVKEKWKRKFTKAQMSINVWWNQKIMVYSLNVMIYSNEKH